MTYLEKYRKMNDEEQATTQGISNPYDDVADKAARDQNWKAYYNSQVQNYRVNELAQKYLKNSLQQQGMATQGAMGTAGTQLSNAFLNQGQTNLSNYYDTEADISSNAYSKYQQYAEQMAQEDAARDSELIGYLTSATTTAEAQQYLRNAGYIDDSGNYTSAWNELDDDRKRSIANALTKQQTNVSDTSSLESQLTSAGSQAMDFDTLANSKFGNENDADGWGSDSLNKRKYGVAKELDAMRNLTEGNPMSYNGTLFTLKGTFGNRPVYVMFLNGKYYRVTEDYANSYGGNKKTISYASGSSDSSSSTKPYNVWDPSTY